MLKTSFFNKAVFKRNLRGYWPLWAAYLGVMILLIPIPLHSNLMYGWYDTPDYLITSNLSSSLTISLVIGAFFSIFAAMAVFSYMYTPRAANMTASLPVSRTALYSTNFLTILFVTVAVHVITAICIALSIIFVNVEYLYIIPILQWMLLGILMTLFFICLSCFCATLTGSVLILPCVYGVINFSAILIQGIMSNIFSEFLYGYAGDVMPDAILWLTPSVKLMSIATRTPYLADDGSYIAFGSMPTILIYIAVGILLLVAGLLIHKNRRTESASDIIAVKTIKPAVKFFFAALGSLTLGMLINSLLFYSTSGNIIAYSVSMIIGGFIGYFASEMLVTKSFKVWRKWKGFVIYCVVVIAFITGLGFDISGFETAIPRDTSIEFAEVNIYGEEIAGSDAETVQTALRLHEYIIEHRDDKIDYDGITANVDITYELKGGAVVSRTYYCNLPDFIIEAFNAPELCYERVCLNTEFNLNKMNFATVEFYDGSTSQAVPLTEEQFYELYNRMISDIGTSSVGCVEFGISMRVEEAVILTAEFDIDKYSGSYYFYQPIPVDATRCMEYLDILEIDYSPVN